MENSRDGEKSIRTVLMTPVVIFLELIRILFIMAIVVGILGYIVGNVYLEIGTDIDKYGWMTYIAILTLIFVLYRNKLQFSGWYKGKGREKLPKLVSQILIFTSISLLFLPPVLSFLFN
ncbi:hypothetical protein [Psychrobacillus sp. OK032]|uniref:hypothetical protein n=1 Tax=Psychrobacillus sp. OK032 TaxID=1884358 RepID=UPI0008B2F6F5|nr:hypothetical protein [Psychrobacillus sp. OK032]SES06978.1 hypothetical protein SAMN05518872_1043 [Psychrobacillus sp. OK032]